MCESINSNVPNDLDSCRFEDWFHESWICQLVLDVVEEQRSQV